MSEDEEQYAIVTLSNDRYVMPFDRAVEVVRYIGSAQKIKYVRSTSGYADMILPLDSKETSLSLQPITYTQVLAMCMLGEANDRASSNT